MVNNQDLFYSFALEVNSLTDSDQLLNNVLDKLTGGMELQTGIIYILDNSGEQLLLKAHCGISKKISNKLSKRSLNNDQTAIEVIFSNVPIVQRDLSRTDKIYKTFIKSEKSCFLIYIPISNSDGTIGLIVFQGSDNREFTEDDKLMFKNIGRVLGQAIKHTHKDEETRRSEELSALLTISDSVSSSLDLKEILQNTTRQMVELFHVDHSGILTYDENCEWGRVVAESPDRGAVHEKIHIKGYAAAEKIIADHQPLMIEDTMHDPLMASVHETMVHLDIHSMLILPMVINGKTIGSIGLDSMGKKRTFSSEEIVLAQAIAGQVSIAIENARLFEAEQSRRKLAEILGEVSRAIGSELDMKSLLHIILKQLKNILPFETTSIMLFSGEENIIAATLGYKNEALVCREMPFYLQKSPIIKRIIQTLQPIIIQDVREEKDWIWVPGAEHVRSWMGVPLIAGNKVTGVLSIDKNQVGFYTGKDVETVQALTEQTAMAIENARLFKDLGEEKGRLELLYDLSSRFTSDLEFEKMMQGIIDRITSELGGYIGYLFSFEPDKKMLRMQAVSGIEVSSSILDNEARLSPGQGLNGWVVLNKKPAVVPDVTKDRRWYHVDEIDHNVHAAISVPLFLGKKVVGVITVLHPDMGYFEDSEYLHLLTAVSNQVAVIMEKAFLYKKLKDSEERFYHVTANTGDWVWEIDSQKRITYSSPVVTQILGYSNKEVLGKHVYDFFPPEESEKFKSEYNKIYKTKKPFTALVTCNLHKDGHKVMLESSGIPILDRNGKLTGYRGADHDITTRLQAEQALAVSEQKYRILVENANNWIWTLDLEGQITFFNRTAEEASGYKSAEWTGQNFAPLILSEELPAVQQIYSEILKGKSKSYETRVYTKDGKVITLAVNTALLYKDGVITGTVNMGQDITKQKQLETQLRQAQKMEAIGTLAGGIAHDFNNILNGILGYVSLMKLDVTSDNPLCKELDAVISLVKRASDLTQQLLAFARGGKYQIQPTNLNDSINEVLQLLSRTMNKSIRIKPVLDPDLSIIAADAGQIQQMILNLCLNAGDAMPEGGVLLIETKNIDLTEHSDGNILDFKAENYVLLNVSDTGIGMDDKTKERIFDPFFTTKTGMGKSKHSGLGLSMIYGIVKNHKGIIKVYSEPGEGTNLKIYLPATNLEMINTENKRIAPAGGKETILIIDDEETILRPVIKILDNAGYIILLVNGGKKAIELFKKQYKEIDLVILDLIMPDMNGRETYNKLKEIDPEVTVLLSSGYSRNRQVQELINSGVKDFLQKPYEFENLLIKVRQVLDQK